MLCFRRTFLVFSVPVFLAALVADGTDVEARSRRSFSVHRKSKTTAEKKRHARQSKKESQRAGDKESGPSRLAAVAQDLWAVIPGDPVHAKAAEQRSAAATQVALPKYAAGGNRKVTIETLSQLASRRLVAPVATRSQPIDPPLHGFAQQAEGFAQSYDLLAGQCYAVLGAGEESMAHLSVIIWRPDATRLLSIVGKREPFAAFRATEGGKYKLVARPAMGAGSFAVGVYEYACPDETFAQQTSS